MIHLRAKCILQPVKKFKRETNQNTKKKQIVLQQECYMNFFASIACIFNAIFKFCLQQSGSGVKNSKLGKQDI